MEYSTEIFQLTPSAYVSSIMGRWLVRNIWILITPFVAALVAAGFFGPAFLYVGLMLMFLVYPTVMMTVYFNYALKPEARRAIARSRVTVTDDELSLEHVPDDGDGSDARPVGKFTVPVARIRDLRFSRDRIVIVTGKKVDDIIVVPVSAFGGDKTDLRRFIERICRSIQRNSLTLQS